MFRAQGDVGKKRPRRSWAFYDYMHFLRNCLNEKRLHPVSDEFEDSNFMEKSDFNEDENDDSYLTPNEQISSILTDNFYGQSQPQISIKNEVMENSTIEHDRNMDTSNISSSQSIHLENSEEGTSNNSAITSSYASQNPSFNSYSNIMPSGEALINSGDPITIVSHNGNNMSNQAQPSQLPPDSTRFTKIRPSGRILPSSQSSSHYSTPITSGAASAKAKPNNSLSMNFDETLDADLAFGRAVGLELQRLDEYQKGVAKIRIQQVLLDARFRTSPNSGL
uniref:BESS domain-containing protein n=1 Tax=Acrobeloides nanus TaxID=290746 RepID=A0A914EL86_9BILA